MRQPLSAEDVARVAVGLLTSESVPAGGAYPLIGEVLALRDIIATFGRVLGRDVRYEDIPDEQWRRDALQRGYNPHAVEHLSQLWRAFRNAGLDSGPVTYEISKSIETLGGTRPKTFETFVREERDALLSRTGEPTA